MRNLVSREPVVTAFVVAAAALAAAFGFTIDTGYLEAAKDWGSLALAAFSVLKARSKVSPV